MATDSEQVHDVSGIVMATLSAERPTISGMLQAIAEQMGGFGCTLWEVAPQFDLDAVPPSNFLLTVGAWWESKDLFAMDNLSPETSMTASVAISQFAQRCSDVRNVEPSNSFWNRRNVRGMCSSPVKFMNGAAGAI